MEGAVNEFEKIVFFEKIVSGSPQLCSVFATMVKIKSLDYKNERKSPCLA